MSVAQVHTLASLQLPETAPIRRDAPAGCSVLQDTFWDRYDSQTLIYDCHHNAARGEIHITVPKPLNLKPQLAAATLRSGDHKLVRRKWHKARHHDRIVFAAPKTVDTLNVTLAGITAELPVYAVDHDLTGRNVLYTMSRNNDLAWIKDWAAFHAAEHGADAVVLCDNGSDAYSCADIAETLAEIPALKAIRVIAAPLPFGPRKGDCTRWSDAKFLQTSLMNICKYRFMAHARAILNLDIDELVVSPTRESIFDAAVQSRFGHVTFPGVWHHAKTEAPRHADHIFQKPGDAPCPTKYAVCPTRLIGKAPMQVHALTGFHRNLFIQPQRFHYLHCRSISTSWKSDRTPDHAPALTLDPAAQQVLEKAFGKTAP